MIYHYKYFCIIDGTTAGDGTTVGKCPTTPSGLLCLSDGECNKCKLIAGTYQGCDIYSTTSAVCDADSTTAVIDDTATVKLAECKPCTKSGWCIFIML